MSWEDPQFCFHKFSQFFLSSSSFLGRFIFNLSVALLALQLLLLCIWLSFFTRVCVTIEFSSKRGPNNVFGLYWRTFFELVRKRKWEYKSKIFFKNYIIRFLKIQIDSDIFLIFWDFFVTCTLIFIFWLNSKKSANVGQKYCLDPSWREFYHNADSSRRSTAFTKWRSSSYYYLCSQLYQWVPIHTFVLYQL